MILLSDTRITLPTRRQRTIWKVLVFVHESSPYTDSGVVQKARSSHRVFLPTRIFCRSSINNSQRRSYRNTMPFSLPFILPLIAFGLLWLRFRPQVNKKGKGLTPPGPPADPIIGHVRFVPASRPELTYTKWGKQYSLSLHCTAARIR